MWMQSPRHRANMMLGGRQAVASAVSASGRRYWVMEIGGGGGEAQAATFPQKEVTRRKLAARYASPPKIIPGLWAKDLRMNSSSNCVELINQFHLQRSSPDRVPFSRILRLTTKILCRRLIGAT